MYKREIFDNFDWTEINNTITTARCRIFQCLQLIGWKNLLDPGDGDGRHLFYLRIFSSQITISKADFHTAFPLPEPNKNKDTVMTDTRPN